MKGGGSKIDFLRGLDWSKGGNSIEWIGDEGFIRLPGGRTAVISLTTRASGHIPTVDHWNGLHVRVRHFERGTIDEKYFPWRDHLVLAAKQEHPNADPRNGLCVISYVGWHWYINQPESTRPIVDAVMRWIGTFEP